MPRLRLTVAARQDLIDIQQRGLEIFGPEPVRKHMQGFERIFALLRTHPVAGAEMPDYGEDIWVFSHRPHRLLYRATEHEILIVRIIHSAMDAPTALENRP